VNINTDFSRSWEGIYPPTDSQRCEKGPQYRCFTHRHGWPSDEPSFQRV